LGNESGIPCGEKWESPAPVAKSEQHPNRHVVCADLDLNTAQFRMLRIVNTTELAHEHHGGSDASSAQIPAIALEWLKDASEGAESLITNSCFKATFEKFSQVDSMTPAQIYNYGSLLDAGLQLLEGIQICVAPLGHDYVKYMYPAADVKVADNKKIYISVFTFYNTCAN